MNLYSAIIFIYLAVSVLVCKLAQRKKQGTQGMFVANRQLSQGLLIPLLFAGFVGGTTITSAASYGFTNGLTGAAHMIGMCLGGILFLLYIGKPYRILVEEKGVLSVPDAFAVLFDEKVKNLMVLVIALTNCMILATVPKSIASLLAPILGVEQELMVWVVWAIWLGVTLLGGLKGIAAMNIVHMGVMIVAFVSIVISGSARIGGISGVYAALGSGYFSLASGGVMTMIATVLGAAIAQPTNTVISSAVFSGSDYKTSKRGILISCLLLVPFGFLVAYSGMIAKVIAPQSSPAAALSTMAMEIGPLFAVMISMSCCAATISTAPASLLNVTNIFCFNIFKPYFKKDATDAQLKLFSILFAVIVSVGLTLLGGSAPSLLYQLTGAAQINSVSGVVLIIALKWKRVDCNGVFWSLLLGTVVGTVWYNIGTPFGISVLWIAFPVSVLSLVLMTLFTKKRVSDRAAAWERLQEQNRARRAAGSEA